MSAADSYIASERWSPSLRRTLLIILGVWLAALGCLVLLGALGLPYGMNVWPLGEDRSWGEWMQRSRGLALPRDYWSHHDRNPLNPWWYVAASPLINAADWGLYAVRKAIDLLLAVATLLLCDRLLHGRARPISLALAILVLFWNFSGYREQVIWNFLGAMAVSLLAIAAFTHYVDSDRRNAGFALVAAALFLVATASYTLQIGIAFTLVVLSFFRRAAESSEASWRKRLADPTPWLETASIGVIAVTFLVVWYTTSRPATGYFSLNATGVAWRIVESLFNLIWHVDYTELLGATIRRMDLPLFLAAVTVISLGVLLCLARTVDAADVRVLADEAVWIVTVIVGVSLVLLVAEAGNPQWPPGSRSRMVQQFVSPAIVVLLLALLASTMMQWGRTRAGIVFFRLGFSAVLAIALVVGLEYNRQLIELTRTQRQLAQQLRAFDEAHRASHYLILTDYDPTQIWGSDGLSDATARVLLGRSNVTLRFVQAQGPPELAFEPFWRIVFFDDDVGIGNARLGVTAPLPYDDVAVLRMRNGQLELPEVLDRGDFVDRKVDWRRSAGLRQRTSVPRVCPWRFDFDRVRFLESGWSVVEPWPGGGSAVWMAARKATLRTDSSCAGSLRIRAWVVGSMSPRILDSLRVSAGGRSQKFVPTMTGPAQGVTMEALLEAKSTATLTFTVDETARPAGGNRDLAVMLREVVIAPAAK